MVGWQLEHDTSHIKHRYSSGLPEIHKIGHALTVTMQTTRALPSWFTTVTVSCVSGN
jgi:hypothetical protein